MSSLLHQAAQKAVEALSHAAECADPHEPLWDELIAAITALESALQQQPEPVAQASALYEAIKHGDEEHKEWLRESLAAFFAGQPVPAPRGYGNKEARIAELECELSALQHQEEPREPVAWYDPSNHSPAQSVTFKKAVRNEWPHLFPVALYASPSTTRQQEVGSEPALLFDGYYVYSEGLTDQAKQRTSPENVADVLDAVVRLMRAAPSTPEKAGGVTPCRRCGADEPRTGTCSGDGPLCAPGVAVPQAPTVRQSSNQRDEKE